MNNEPTRPWYRTPSILISLTALTFSVGSALVSAVVSHKEDVRANRRDARVLLQRLSKLPIENYELMHKFKGTGQGEALSGMINQENVLIATQAAELIDRYPDSFTSAEYFATASALAASNIIDKVPSFFQRALETARSASDYNAAARAYAVYLYGKGEYTEGRKHFELALKTTWEKYPERSMAVVHATDMLTLLYWSQSEYTARNTEPARDLLAQSRRKLGQLPPSPYREALASQADYTARFVEGHLAAPAPPQAVQSTSLIK
jgi:tetratricopeptide (TPR) repeat protein